MSDPTPREILDAGLKAILLLAFGWVLLVVMTIAGTLWGLN